MKKKIIKVNNRMQTDYEYELTETMGKNFHKDFKPELTPKQMLSMGIMSGKYFNDVVKTNEYPKDWFENAKMCGLDNPPDDSLNYYGVAAGSSLKDWKDKGWINQQDTRGWFEWFCRYFHGRRSPDDARQIKRWQNASRFIKSAESYYGKHGKHSLVWLQTALHWGYDPRRLLKKTDMDKESVLFNW